MFLLAGVACLDLNNQASLNQQIGSICTSDVAVIMHGDGKLSGDGQSAFAVLVIQGTDVDVLEKASAQGVVNAVEPTNDDPRQGLINQGHDMSVAVCLLIPAHQPVRPPSKQCG